MRKTKSHFSGNRRIRSGIFYFLSLMALLEVVRQNTHRLSISRESDAGPDSLVQALADSLRSLQHEARTPDRQGGSGMQEDTGISDGYPGRPATGTATPPGVRDLNSATPAQLREIRGVGPVLSARIVKFRDALGGFLDPRQVYDVYGLSPEVAGRLLRSFPLLTMPEIQKLNINTATEEELSGMLYLNRQMARELVGCRERNGPFKSLGEIACAASIPKEKIERIALYLTLTN